MADAIRGHSGASTASTALTVNGRSVLMRAINVEIVPAQAYVLASRVMEAHRVLELLAHVHAPCMAYVLRLVCVNALLAGAVLIAANQFAAAGARIMGGALPQTFASASTVGLARTVRTRRHSLECTTWLVHPTADPMVSASTVHAYATQGTMASHAALVAITTALVMANASASISAHAPVGG